MTTDEQRAIITAASRLLRREVALVRPLTGGQHAATLLVTDDTLRYVVKAFPPGDDASAREAAILERLRPLGAFVPRLIAHHQDPHMPIIVTSAIHGTPPEPGLPTRSIAAQMAAALAHIHRLDGSGLRPAPAQPPDGDNDVAARARREWDRLDRSEMVLTHFDFWCGNALWDANQLTGIVDWSGARSAPRGVDVAWCRLDLVLLGSSAAAEQFLVEYEHHTGRPLRDITSWDLQAAAEASSAVDSWEPNYEGIGRTDLTAETLRQRLDTWVATL